MIPDVRLVDEEGTPMSTPNTSGDDDSEDEVGSLSLNSSLDVTWQMESDGGMTEIRFVPDDATSLDSMFAAMSECQVTYLYQKP